MAVGQYRKPANLSGGQPQQVAMGRAIVRSPKAYLTDEQLSNLDAKRCGRSVRPPGDSARPADPARAGAPPVRTRNCPPTEPAIA